MEIIIELLIPQFSITAPRNIWRDVFYSYDILGFLQSTRNIIRLCVRRQSEIWV